MRLGLGNNLIKNGGGLNPDGLALDLQFAADKTLTARRGPTPVLTRSQTSSTGSTYVGSDGLIKYAAANEPRFDHNPTLPFACRGLLIEEQRENFVTHSSQFNNAVWAKNGVNIGEDQTTSPDGTVSAERLTEQSGSLTRSGTFFTLATLSSVPYTFSVFIKNDSGSRFARIILNADNATTFACVDVNPSTGEIAQTLNSNTTDVSSSSVAAGAGWWRVSITATLPVKYVTIALITGSSVPAGTDFGYQSYTGNGTSGIFIWGAQLEAGSFPTSYIPTTTSPLTRSADVCSITGEDFTSFYNQSEGTIYTESRPSAVNGTTTTFGLSNGTSNERWLNRFAQNEQAVITSTGTESTLDALNPIAGTLYKVATAAKLNDIAMSINGLAVVTDTSQPMPVVDRAGIGNTLGAAASLGAATIAAIRYYKKRLPNEKLQALTV